MLSLQTITFINYKIAMEKKINIAEVAEKAGVSTATVSRVINDYPFVREETKKKVLKVIDETHYRVNAVARNLRRKKTHSVGVIISNVLSPFYSIIAKAVEDVANKNNYSTILCNGGDSPEKERKYLKVLHENRVDGIILSPTGKNKDYLNYLISSGIPIAFIDRVVEGVNCDTVMVNNREASYNAIDYLIKKGYRKIATVAGPMDRTTGIERLEGYIKAHKDNGIDIDKCMIRYGDFSLESGKKHTLDLIENTAMEAVFVANTDMATGAFQIIKEKKLKVPKDIAFVMFDDPAWTTLVTPNITAVAQPVYTLGSTTADLLLKRVVEGRRYIDKEPVKVILEAKLIVRESA